MKIKVEKVRTWKPQGSRNGPQNQLKIDEKTHLATAGENASKNHLKIDEKIHLVTASAAKPDFVAPGSIWGYPPCPKMVQNHTKKRVRQQRHDQNFHTDPLPLRYLLPVSTCQGVSVFVLQVPHVVFLLFSGVMSGNYILR